MQRLRRRIFIGCEGSGERSLATVLQKFADEAQIPVALDPFDAQGGSPLDMLRRVIREMKLREKRRGLYPGGAFFLVDQDRITREGCSSTVLNKAKENRILLVRQQSKLECLIGRLLSKNWNLGDARAEAALYKIWPDFDKGFDATSLKAKLDITTIRQSKATHPEWMSLLRATGFIR